MKNIFLIILVAGTVFWFSRSKFPSNKFNFSKIIPAKYTESLNKKKSKLLIDLKKNLKKEAETQTKKLAREIDHFLTNKTNDVLGIMFPEK